MPANDPYEYLRDALDAVRKFNASPAVDDVDTEAGEKVTSLIQGILSGIQKEEEGLMQGKMSPRAMSRAYSQAPAEEAAPAAGGMGGEDPLAALFGG